MVNEYLVGLYKSNCYRFNVEKDNSLPNRLDLIENLVRYKKVVDLGFADEVNLIKKKLDKDEWLHKRISQSARRCLGIDINCEAVDWCKRNTPQTNLVCANISNELIREILYYEWDYLVMGELLEHLDSPVDFLKNIKERYGSSFQKIILTVPNAFRMNNFKNALHNFELINSDHRFWFTPYTLHKVAHRAGYKVNWYQLCQGIEVPFYKFHKRYLLKKFPLLRDTIIMEIQ